MLSLHLPKKHTCAYIYRTEKTLGSGLVPRMAQLLHYASVPQGPRSFGAGIQLCPFPYPLILGLTTWHKRNVGRWDPSQRPEMSLHIKAHSFFFLHLPLRRNWVRLLEGRDWRVQWSPITLWIEDPQTSESLEETRTAQCLLLTCRLMSQRNLLLFEATDFGAVY